MQILIGDPHHPMEIIIVIVSTLSIIVTSYLARSSPPLSLFIFATQIQYFFGSYFYLTEFDIYRMRINPYSPELLLQSISAILVFTLIYFLFFELLRRTLPKRQANPQSNKTMPALRALFALYALIAFFILTKLYPIFDQINFEDNATFIRSKITENIISPLFLFLKDSLLIFIFYIIIQSKKIQIKVKVLILLITIFILLTTLQKSPFVSLIIGLIFLYAIKTDNLIKSGLTALFILLPAVLLTYMAFMQSENLIVGTHSLISRITQAALGVHMFYLNHFAQPSIEYFGLQGLPNPAGLFPYEPTSLAKHMYKELQPNSSLAGSMSSHASAEAFAICGPSCLIVIPIIFALLHSLVYVLGHSLMRYEIYQSAWITWYAIYLMKLASSGIIQTIFPIQPFLIILTGVLLRKVSRHLPH